MQIKDRSVERIIKTNSYARIIVVTIVLKKRLNTLKSQDGDTNARLIGEIEINKILNRIFG